MKQKISSIEIAAFIITMFLTSASFSTEMTTNQKIEYPAPIVLKDRLYIGVSMGYDMFSVRDSIALADADIGAFKLDSAANTEGLAGGLFMAMVDIFPLLVRFIWVLKSLLMVVAQIQIML